MSEMNQAIDYLLDQAERKKMDLEVMAVQSSSTGISFSARKMDQFSFSETRQVGVRLISGKHEGVAYSESLDQDSLEQILAEAQANARMIHREWISELRPAGHLPTMDSLYNPALAAVPIEAKIARAQELEEAALSFDPRITNVPFARYGDSHSQMWLANSKGLRGEYQTNVCYAYARCLAKDGEQSVMGGEYDSQHGFENLHGQRVAQTAARKTLERMGAERPVTGKYTVVFENRVAESLVGMVAGYFSGKAIDDKTSPLMSKLGQKVFSPNLNLTDDPFLVDGAGSRPFDDEGYASIVTPLIQDGVVTSFLTNSVLARKLKLGHTASAARSPSSDLDVSSSNLVVASGIQSMPELLAADSKVILVTDLMGTAGFRAASGDFSIPIEGFMYENGKRVRPLKDFLMSGNLLQLLGNVQAVGNDARSPIGNIVCPSLLVRDLNIAGRTS